tara:strand:- start:542 stop:727 length:186 start_codon:yes stop_codon:yes gene_type:complete
MTAIKLNKIAKECLARYEGSPNQVALAHDRSTDMLSMKQTKAVLTAVDQLAELRSQEAKAC